MKQVTKQVTKTREISEIKIPLDPREEKIVSQKLKKMEKMLFMRGQD